ncbi:MAG: CBS domain-containing protein [Pyrinomonadaceae bacterium]
MKLVKHILDSKGDQIWHIRPDESVFEAIRLMAEKGVGALLVMEEEDLIGIVSERDYARKVILQGKSSRQTPVKEIMTAEVVCTSPDQTVEDCMALMTDNRIRHLPITADDRIVGVLSIGDLVKAIIAEQQFTIEQLEQYISA